MNVPLSTKGLCRSTCEITDRARIVFRSRFYYVFGLYQAASRWLINYYQYRNANGTCFALTACFHTKSEHVRFSSISSRSNDDRYARGARVTGVATLLRIVGCNERSATKAANKNDCCLSPQDILLTCHRYVERCRSSQLGKLFMSNDACVVNEDFPSRIR